MARRETITFKVPPHMLEQLNAVAARRQSSRTSVIVDALRNGLPELHDLCDALGDPRIRRIYDLVGAPTFLMRVAQLVETRAWLQNELHAMNPKRAPSVSP